jgi:DNA-binding XRE family transcriptional regulator
MEMAAGQVIRVLREGLGMTQAELARALDWSPSTISAWERGRVQPSRLSYKIILAFAEERGVRCRPRAAVASSESRSLVPVTRMPVVLPPMPPTTRAERAVTVAATPPGWHVEATFRVSRSSRSADGPRRGRSLVGAAGVAVATLCAALALGLPGARRAIRAPEPAVRATASPARAAAAVTPTVVSNAPDARARAAHPPVTAIAAAAPETRLDGLVLIGRRHRASFRTAGETVTLFEGSRLGAERVATVGPDGVELEGPGGRRRVPLGHRTTPAR